MERKNEISQNSIDFDLETIQFSELLENHHKFVVANQLLKSGTSIGSNVFNIQSTEKQDEFHS